MKIRVEDVTNILQSYCRDVANVAFGNSWKKVCIRLHNVCANKKNITIMCDFSQKIFGDVNRKLYLCECYPEYNLLP